MGLSTLGSTPCTPLLCSIIVRRLTQITPEHRLMKQETWTSCDTMLRMSETSNRRSSRSSFRGTARAASHTCREDSASRGKCQTEGRDSSAAQAISVWRGRRAVRHLRSSVCVAPCCCWWKELCAVFQVSTPSSSTSSSPRPLPSGSFPKEWTLTVSKRRVHDTSQKVFGHLEYLLPCQEYWRS